ncbi:MAG: SurA N-terminal domain-containing protein [Sandaracinaceae bacterium]|jgi:peptidyl-prolyl cis-trans isomerase SurA|nr:SurA N-terminal domain-containing protein [Sandaracinaceae bacterium]
MRIRSLIAGLLLALLGIGIGVRDAHADVIERVVAIVNDEAVFLSDLRRRAAPFLPRAMEASTDEERAGRVRQLYTEVLNLLIDETLIAQAATHAQIHVTNADVENAISNVKRQSQLSETDFWAAVGQQGFTEAQYREDVRRQLVRLRLLNQRARGRVNITETDVRQMYDTQVRIARAHATFVAADILFALPPHPTATQVATARHEAETLRASLDTDNYDDAMTEHNGIELGELQQGQLDPSLEQALLALDEGGISTPIQNAAGFHILLLRGRSAGASQIPEYDSVREQIQRRMMEEAMGRQESIYLQELRHDAVITRHL